MSQKEHKFIKPFSNITPSTQPIVNGDKITDIVDKTKGNIDDITLNYNVREYASTTTYTKGAKVHGNGGLWQSTSSGNVGNPLPSPPLSNSHWLFLSYRALPSSVTGTNTRMDQFNRGRTSSQIVNRVTETPVPMATIFAEEIAELEYVVATNRIRNKSTVSVRAGAFVYANWQAAESAGKRIYVAGKKYSPTGALQIYFCECVGVTKQTNGFTMRSTQPIELLPGESIELVVYHEDTTVIGGSKTLTLNQAGLWLWRMEGIKGEAGAKGDKGSNILTGLTDPDAATGVNGDLYINNTTNDYFSKVDGVWVKQGNIKGAKGDTGLGYDATSTTSNAVGTGGKTFTTQPNKAYLANSYVRISNSATTYMEGTVTSYDVASGVMVVDVTKTAGTGTFTSWNISIAGLPGGEGLVFSARRYTDTQASIPSNTETVLVPSSTAHTQGDSIVWDATSNGWLNNGTAPLPVVLIGRGLWGVASGTDIKSGIKELFFRITDKTTGDLLADQIDPEILRSDINNVSTTLVETYRLPANGLARLLARHSVVNGNDASVNIPLSNISFNAIVAGNGSSAGTGGGTGGGVDAYTKTESDGRYPAHPKVIEVVGNRNIFLTDIGNILYVNAVGDVTLTIRTDTNLTPVAIGRGFQVRRKGTGAVIITAESGVTLDGEKSPSTSVSIALKGQSASFYKEAENFWAYAGVFS